jgi:hypothetical protein
MIDFFRNNVQFIISISAIIISIISLFVTIFALYFHRKHNQLSVKPIAHFSKGDYEDQIFVKIKNYGLGPLIIDRFEINRGNQSFQRLIDSLGEQSSSIVWDTFTDSLDGRVLAPQKEFILMQGSFELEQNNIRMGIRRLLAQTSLTIHYKCIYGKKQSPVTEQLDWFSRT